MKSNAKPSLYFSAYPLKALNKEASAKPSSSQSPYLKAILSGKTRKLTLSRVRVFPMADLYPKVTSKSAPKAGQLPKDTDLAEKEWFNNYE